MIGVSIRNLPATPLLRMGINPNQGLPETPDGILGRYARQIDTVDTGSFCVKLPGIVEPPQSITGVNPHEPGQEIHISPQCFSRGTPDTWIKMTVEEGIGHVRGRFWNDAKWVEPCGEDDLQGSVAAEPANYRRLRILEGTDGISEQSPDPVESRLSLGIFLPGCPFRGFAHDLRYIPISSG
jgi:hypothetical protein